VTHGVFLSSDIKGVPILMYHALVQGSGAGDIAGPEDPVYAIGDDRFEEHVRHLKILGYETISLRKFLDWLLGNELMSPKSIMITFDDGHVSNLTLAVPILAKYNFCAEFFITTGCVGRPKYLDRKQIQALREAGMGVGSHTVSHPMLDNLGEEGIRNELKESKDFLEDLLGEEVIGVSIPGGRTNSDVRSIAFDCGYRAVLTSTLGVNGRRQDPFDIKRIPVRRWTILSQALLERGHDGIITRVLQDICDAGKVLLGNQCYERLRNRLVNSALGDRFAQRTNRY